MAVDSKVAGVLLIPGLVRQFAAEGGVGALRQAGSPSTQRSQSAVSLMSTKVMTHRPQLDALRAFAVVSVVLFYISKLVFGSRLDFLAGLGIGLLFTLSGFLITESLLLSRFRNKLTGMEKRAVLRRFYARRILRIIPLYCLLIALAGLYSIPYAPHVRHMAWWLATFTVNIGVCLKGSNTFGALAHLWSLSAGAQLYLAWPWFLLFARRGALVPGTVLIILLGPLYRWTGANSGYNSDQLYQFTISWCDSFGIGALLAMTRLGTPVDAEDGGFLNRVALPAGLIAIAAFLFASPLRIPGSVAATFFSTACSLAFAWLISFANVGFGDALVPSSGFDRSSISAKSATESTCSTHSSLST